MSEPEITIETVGGTTDQAEKPITVTSRPPHSRPSQSYIPPEVIDYFHSKLHRIGLRARHDVMKAQDDATGWRDIRLSEQPERVKEMLKRIFTIENDLVYRGDWIVRERSFAAHEQQKAWQQAERDTYENADYVVDGLDDKISQLSKDHGGAGVGVTIGDRRSIKEDTIGGPDAVRAGVPMPEDILRAVEERKKQGK